MPRVPYSKAAETVAEINRLDLRHRKGFRPSDFIGKMVTGEALSDEVDELVDALFKFAGNVNAFDVDRFREDVKMEMADVFQSLLQIAYRFNMTFEDLDEYTVYKAKLRFAWPDKAADQTCDECRLGDGEC